MDERDWQALLERIERLEKHGVCGFDPAAFRYVRVLADRAGQLSGAARDRCCSSAR